MTERILRHYMINNGSALSKEVKNHLVNIFIYVLKLNTEYWL